MEERNIFEIGTRKKVTFETSRGTLDIQQVWDMPLESSDDFNLDTLARKLYKALKEQEETSFVKRSVPNKQQELLQLKFDIVKHIIDYKLKEKEEAEKALERKAKKEKLLKLIQEKEMEKLKEMDLDDLKKMVNEL